jgi:small subunit ribosomal protein S16
MPTTIRMSRAGAKKRPYYRIVVTNSRSPRDSKFIEKLGTYNPLLGQGDAKRVTINTDRVKYWLSTGAQMSDRVHLFFNQAGLVSTKPAFSVARKSKKEMKAAAENAGAPAAPAAAKPAAEVAAPAESAEASAKAEGAAPEAAAS